MLDIGVEQGITDHLERYRVDVGAGCVVQRQRGIDAELLGRDVTAGNTVPGHRGHRAVPLPAVSGAGSRRRKCPRSAVSDAARGTAIVVCGSSTRAGPVISPPSETVVATRFPASGQNTGTVRVGEPAAAAGPVPGADAAVPVIARVAAGTRARTRSAKISAAWKADAAEGPYRRPYSCVNCAA